MMDFADEGSEAAEARTEALVKAAREAAQKAPTLTVTGSCHNPKCGDDTDKVFCNPKCRDEYDRQLIRRGGQ